MGEQSVGKTEKITKIILITFVVTLIIGSTAFAIAINTPRVKLARAGSNMLKELGEYSTNVDSVIDFGKIKSFGETNPQADEFKVNFVLPKEKGINSFGILLKGVEDKKERKADYDLSANVMNVPVISSDIAVNDNTLFVAVPKLFEDTYSVKLDTIGADFNSSQWSDYLGMDLEDDISYDFFADWKLLVLDDKTRELIETIAEDAKPLKEAVTYEKFKDELVLETNEKTVKSGGGVRVCIPKDVINEFNTKVKNDVYASDFYKERAAHIAEDFATLFTSSEDIKAELDEKIEEILGQQLDADLYIDFYLDNKNRIVKITTGNEIHFADSDINGLVLDIIFTGKDRALDCIDGSIKVDKKEKVTELSVNRNASVTNELYSEDTSLKLKNGDRQYTTAYKNQWNYLSHEFDGSLEFGTGKITGLIEARGGFGDIVKGESYAFDVDSASVTLNDTQLLRMSASYAVKPFDSETIEIPANAKDILGMSSDEISDFVRQTLWSILKLAGRN